VQSYRRVRDLFLDLQYRAQATRLGEESGHAEGLERAELSLAEPSDNGISKQLSQFWTSWSNLANAADDTAARQALVEQGGALADAFGTVDGQLALVGQHAGDEYAALTAPGGEVQQVATEIVKLNATINKFVTAGDPPNDLMDQRDQLLDRLSSLGQTSIQDRGDGSVQVTFGGPADPPMIDAAGYHAPAVVETIADSVNTLSPGFFSYTERRPRPTRCPSPHPPPTPTPTRARRSAWSARSGRA
jgi:flagellar hook-associated protein 1 FlgK